VSADQPGEQIRVWVLGTWQPAIVIGSTGRGHVPACDRRLDGQAVVPCRVLEATAS
jgi:hypothetical protein